MYVYVCIPMCTLKGQYKLMKQCLWLTWQKWNAAFYITEFLLLPCVLRQFYYNIWKVSEMVTNSNSNFLNKCSNYNICFLASIFPLKSFWSDWFLYSLCPIQTSLAGSVTSLEDFNFVKFYITILFPLMQRKEKKLKYSWFTVLC